MPLLRTPDERFANLDFTFEPHYVEINGARVHYIDEGSGETILCLHGEPTWSYLYRKMIPILAAHHRVIAMDFIGFGRSDKFSNPIEYTFEMHRQTIESFITALDLKGITAVVQDWGGILGLRVATQIPDRIRATGYHEHRTSNRRCSSDRRFYEVARICDKHSGSALRNDRASQRRRSRLDHRRNRFSLRRAVPGPYIQGGRADVSAAGAYRTQSTGGIGYA